MEPLIQLDDGTICNAYDLARRLIPGQPSFLYSYILWNCTDYPFLETGVSVKRLIKQLKYIQEVLSHDQHIPSPHTSGSSRSGNVARSGRGH